MKTSEIIDRLEDAIDSKITNTEISELEKGEIIPKDVFYLSIQFILNIVKNPFEFISKYLKEEIIPYIKKDAGLYMLIMSIVVVLFVFFSVIWLFVSIAVGAYFYEHGNTLFISIIYSIIFQIVSSITALLIIYVASKNLESLKILKKFSK